MHQHDITQLSTVLQQQKNPFDFDLDIKFISSQHDNAQVTICCHGYGDSNRLVEIINSYGVIPDHLIGFNFPDYAIDLESYEAHINSSYGSIAELLPLVYVIKLCVIDAGLPSINLYGFSAGGGVIVNALAVLNTNKYDQRLATIGITAHDKQRILTALERGLIILDCPLKSVEEILDVRGQSPELMIMAEHYQQHNMNPIDVLEKLKGLKLHILLHFQQPDDILGNRDDQLFIDRLRNNSAGKVEVVIGNEGGHNSFHASLWKRYKQLKKELNERA